MKLFDLVLGKITPFSAGKRRIKRERAEGKALKIGYLVADSLKHTLYLMITPLGEGYLALGP